MISYNMYSFLQHEQQQGTYVKLITRSNMWTVNMINIQFASEEDLVRSINFYYIHMFSLLYLYIAGQCFDGFSQVILVALAFNFLQIQQ